MSGFCKTSVVEPLLEMSLHVILQESLFSTVVMFILALHAQNLYRQTLSYKQSSNLYLYMFKILKVDSLVIVRFLLSLCVVLAFLT